jgi:type I restriction enzyme S subunit
MRKLGELAEIKDSARISNEFWVEEGVPYLRSSDLANEKLQGELFISKETYEGFVLKTGSPQKGDVLFTSGGEVGVVYHKEDKSPIYVQGGAILYIKTSTSKLLDGSFMSIYFMSPRMQTYMDVASSGGTIKHFTLKPANASPVIFPYLAEQQKIGDFFKVLDERIANQERKVAKVKALKSAYLTEMFPQEGEAVPKRRFKEFGERWKLTTLNSVCSDISDGDWIENEHINNSGKYRIIQTGNIGVGKFLNRERFAKYINQKSFDELKANEVFPGDILISRLAEPAGRSIIVPDVDKRMVTAVDVTIIRVNDCFDEYFLITQINSEDILSKINENVSGTSHKRISRKNLEKTLLNIPQDIKEQQKIGQFFKNLDDQISTEEKKLEKLQKMKEAYLEEMFV